MCQLCRIGPLSAPHQEVQQEGGQTMNDGVFTVETHPQNFSTAILAVMDEANKDLILGSFKVTTLLLKDGTKRRDLASILARYIEGGFQGPERVQWETFFDPPLAMLKAEGKAELLSGHYGVALFVAAGEPTH